MKRRTVSAISIIGAVYALIGSIFAILGGCFLYFGDETELSVVGGVFVLLGAVFLLLGGIFLLVRSSQRKRQAALVAENRYIWAQICDITVNRNVQVNGRSPVVFTARYSEGGREHLFRSGNIRYYRDERLLGQQVRIYIPQTGFKPYYMDVEALLPETVEH